MTERRVPTQEEVDSYLSDHRNWGRWGIRGPAGTMNLVTAEKRLRAVALVKSGRIMSLSRPLPVTPSIDDPSPVHHYVLLMNKPPTGGAARDYLGFVDHSGGITHIDALCHMWNQDGTWEGHDPSEVWASEESRFGTIDQWSNGILTRGVLLDVPKHRGKPHVTLDEPVHGWELEDIAEEEGVALEPGDALLVYSGRESFAREHGGGWAGWPERPGLHASCLPFIRDNDIAILGWDMADASPNEYGVPWTVHAALFSYGVAFLDNALLQPLSEACAEEGRYEFMLSINPLNLIGGTGSPVNPIVVF